MGRFKRLLFLQIVHLGSVLPENIVSLLFQEIERWKLLVLNILPRFRRIALLSDSTLRNLQVPNIQHIEGIRRRDYLFPFPAWRRCFILAAVKELLFFCWLISMFDCLSQLVVQRRFLRFDSVVENILDNLRQVVVRFLVSLNPLFPPPPLHEYHRGKELDLLFVELGIVVYDVWIELPSLSFQFLFRYFVYLLISAYLSQIKGGLAYIYEFNFIFNQLFIKLFFICFDAFNETAVAGKHLFINTISKSNIV